jgi:membrane associated rhomboid family serine protease
MIPLRDENPTKSRALITVLLIGANVIVALWQWFLPTESSTALVQAAALIPARLGGTAALDGIPPPLTLLTSQFLHGGPIHLGGNMLFLWIFGNNVEDELGSIRFLILYLLGGTIAGLVH